MPLLVPAIGRRVWIWVSAATLAFCLTSSGASADSSVSPQAQSRASTKEPSLPQITVEAQRRSLEHHIFDFVTAVTKQVSSHESLARWHIKVCPLVAGIPRDQGEFILERISTIAQAAGAPLGPQDCKPNLLVLVTQRPAQLLDELWSRNPGMFAGIMGEGVQLAAIRRFINSARPIRAWYNAEFAGAAGNSLGVFDMPRGGISANRFPDASRITWDDVQNITSVLLVVDARRIDGLKIGAMADYIAMLGLAKINLDADFSGDESVLQLFTAHEEGQTLSKLSTWDAAFLKALYSTEQSYKMQRSLIVTSMMRDLAP